MFNGKNKNGLIKPIIRNMTSAVPDFQNHLNDILLSAQNKGFQFVDVKSGDLHKRVGAHSHRMPMCCSVMKTNMRTGDKILHEPPSGQGASLIIRYILPRG
ncbi:MAG: HNH endonuclease [Methanosarcinales archaeon]|nr:MAG: HNH endonuclease [Methanosarcinales archaeon]